MVVFIEVVLTQRKIDANGIGRKNAWFLNFQPKSKKEERDKNGIKIRFPKRFLANVEELRSTLKPIEENCNLCEYPIHSRVFEYHKDGKYFADAIIRKNIHNQRNPNQFIITVLASVNEKHTVSRKDRRKLMFLRKRIYGIINSSSNNFKIRAECKAEIPEGIFASIAFNCRCPEVVLQEILEKKKCFTISLFYEHSNLALLRNPLLIRNCLHGKQDYHKKQNLAICSMIHQLDMEDILEWIEYNFMVGVDHIYLYNHLGRNMEGKYDTGLWTILDPYIHDGKVDVFMWNFSYPQYYREEKGGNSKYAGDQIAAFNDCLYRFGSEYKFMTFIDNDEFFVPVEKDNLFDILKQYQNKKGVSSLSSHVYMHSRFRFDTSSDSTSLNMLTERYPHLDNKNVPGINPGVYSKSFIQPKNCRYYWIHSCYHDKNNKMVLHSRTFLDHEKEIYESHYYWKKYDSVNPIYQDFFKILPERYPLQRFIEPLKKRLKIAKNKTNYVGIVKDYQSFIPIDKLSLEFEGDYVYPWGYEQTKENLGTNPEKLAERLIP